MNSSFWCQIDSTALRDNARALKQRVGEHSKLGIVVKSDGYGHGLLFAARAFIEGGADWLIVNSIQEATQLRDARLDTPIYVCGSIPIRAIDQLVASKARAVAFDPAFVDAVNAAAVAAGTQVPLHIKVETGTHRLGLEPAAAIELCIRMQSMRGVLLEGLTTHYADIEDSTNHRFADKQSQIFADVLNALHEKGISVAVPHSANSAATLLWPKTHQALVRVGIAAYGLWPSRETFATALQRKADGDAHAAPALRPALSWHAELAQVKAIAAGDYVGYGRTYRATAAGRIAVVPLGYFEGFDRRLSNVAHVLVRGQRAPVRGRICMNMFMIDVSHIPDACAGDVATLIGTDGDEAISAEQFAQWMGSIHYEAVTRIHPSVPRVLSNAQR